VAYAASYLVGSVVSYSLLSHRLGGLRSRRLLAFGGRLLIATGAATALTIPVAQVLDGLAEDPGPVVAAVRLICVGAVDVLLFLLLARLLRLTEVRAILDLGRRRSR
jgi:putative peptidoglycan lipid II flippase